MTGVVLGIDSSTQSVKVEARRLDTGELVATGTARHPATTPPVSEQDPRTWWAALVTATHGLGEVRNQVVAASVAGQQHGCVLLDDDGEPVRSAKLWNDTTSAPEAAALVDRFGAEVWAERIGSVPVASFTISKLAWVAAHEPDVLARAARVMLPHDYLTWRLTGEHVTDRGDASGSGWFDPARGRTVAEFLAAAVGDWSGALPTVLGPNEPAGCIAAAAADELGLPGDVVIAPGSGDNMGAAMGLGLRAGDVAVSCWPTSLTEAASARTLQLGTLNETEHVVSFAGITRFLALAIKAERDGATAETRFVVPVLLDGIPTNRGERLLAALLADPDRFTRYLLMLLADQDSLLTGLDLLRDGQGGSTVQIDDRLPPIFEALMRAVARHPERLGEIGRIADELERAGGGVLPDGWEAIWPPIHHAAGATL